MTQTPTYEEYRAAGHDHATAEALAGIDKGVAVQARHDALAKAFAKKFTPTNGSVASPRRAESNGRPAASPRARRVDKSSEDDDPHEPAPAERRCRNPRCQDIFSAQDRRRVYCTECSTKAKDPKAGASFRKRVERDLLNGVGLELDGLGLSAGTPADPRTLCKGECSREPHTGGVNGVCHYCAKPRDGIRMFVSDDGLPRRAPSFVSVRNPKHSTLKRKRRRYPVAVTAADGSQETVTRAELTRRSEREVAAA
jgi:hypothetical protein